MPSPQRQETLPERPGDNPVVLIFSAVAITALRAAVSLALEGLLARVVLRLGVFLLAGRVDEGVDFALPAVCCRPADLAPAVFFFFAEAGFFGGMGRVYAHSCVELELA